MGRDFPRLLPQVDYGKVGSMGGAMKQMGDRVRSKLAFRTDIISGLPDKKLKVPDFCTMVRPKLRQHSAYRTRERRFGRIDSRSCSPKHSVVSAFRSSFLDDFRVNPVDGRFVCARRDDAVH